MGTLLAITVGGLYAAAVYMLLRRSLVKLVIGLALLGHAANLLIFTAGGVGRNAPPILGERTGPGEMADPLPQALVLTAIVIGFGVLVFSLVLARCVSRTVEDDDLDRLKGTVG